MRYALGREAGDVLSCRWALTADAIQRIVSENATSVGATSAEFE